MCDEHIDERKIYFDVLRIFAMFSVVFLHTSAINWYKIDVFSVEWNIFNVQESSVRWGVPVFLMISGALFLSKKQPVSKIYKKNILRIFVAFLFWTTFYTMISWHYGYRGKALAHKFIVGEYHLWFLPMLMGVYMIIPFLKMIVDDKELKKYYICLSLIFVFVIPTIINFIKVVSGAYSEMVQKGIDNIQLYFIMGFPIYFVLGDCLYKYTISRNKMKLIYLAGGIGFVSTIVMTYAISRHFNEPKETFYNYLSINVLLESIFVFCVFKKIFSNIKFSDTARRIIVHLSKYSFGIYLVHVFVLDMLEKKGLGTLDFNPVISVPVISVIVFLISLCISAVLNQIPIVKKYIV